MLCPILNSIEVVDDVTAKMDYFFVRWKRHHQRGLVDEMREFFTKIFWVAHNFGDYDTSAFIRRAEKTMDNVMKICLRRKGRFYPLR